MSRKVLVTGGAGMIGSALVKALCDQGDKVIVVDNLSRGRKEFVDPRAKLIVKDIALDQDWRREINGEKFDQIYHLAAMIGGVGKMINDQIDSLINAVIDRNVFKLAVDQAAPLLYCSTACVYRTDMQTAKHSSIFLNEDSALINGAMPESIYGWCKLLGEIATRRLHVEYGNKVSVVRMFNVYGPREYPDLKACHVIPALIRKVLDGNNPVPVWGTGNAERSFLHAEDAARGIMMVAEKTEDGTPINLGQPERYKIKELAQMVIALCESEAEIKLEPEKPEGCFTRAPVIERAMNLGWSPKFDIQEGLKDTISWIRSHRHMPEQVTA